MSTYKGTPANPFHVSVGAVLRDEEGLYLLIRSNDVYSFMCGTIEDHESPEQTLLILRKRQLRLQLTLRDQ